MTAAVNRTAPFELYMLRLEQPDPIEPAHPALPPIRALLHRAPKPTRNLAIYVQSGFTGAPLTGRHDYLPLALALDDVGCSLLVLQSSTASRTHYLKFDTCVNDIRTGLNWAKTLDFNSVVLIGVSMGNARVSYWNAIAPDPTVKAMAFVSTVDSIYLGNGRHWTREERERQDAVLQKCRDLIAAGNGRELVVGELEGYPFPMTAEAYLSYFGQLEEMNASSLKYAPEIKTPIVLIHGTKDVVCPPQGAQAVFDALGTLQKELMWVEDGPHQLMTPGINVNVVSAKVADFVARTLLDCSFCSPGGRSR